MKKFVPVLDRKKMGERIRFLRKSKGLRVTEMAKLGGVTKTAQYNYEKGERVPSLEYLYNLSTMIQIDLTQLITGGIASNNLLNEEEESIINAIRSDEVQGENFRIKIVKEILKIDC